MLTLALGLACVPAIPVISGDSPDPGTDPGTDPGDSPGDTSGDTGTVIIPGYDAPWQRQEIASPGPISINEIAWAPGPAPGGAWIELYNPMAIDVDLSGWRLDGAAGWVFAEGTRIAAGGFLVVAQDPGALAAAGYAGAAGPFTGSLSGGERLDLISNGGRRIDSVRYAGDDPWPVAPDGSGATLAKIRRGDASDRAENWGASLAVGGTPGRDNGLDPRAAPVRTELIAADALWRYDASGAPEAGWQEPGYDDSAWPEGRAVFYAGATDAPQTATLRVTADNYYGLYLGRADGTDLRLIAEDPDGDWTTVEEFEAEVGPEDHLFVAAWEAPWDYGGPQMVIAEAEIGGGAGSGTVSVGTGAGYGWILGLPGDCPGTPAPAPAAEMVADLVAEADLAGAWAAPAAEAAPASDPWGWAVGSAFDADTRYVWPDTFSDTSVTNTDNTWALLRSDDPVIGPAGDTELPGLPVSAAFRARFDYGGPPDPALLLSCRINDGAVVYLNGAEVLRANLPPGAIDAQTPASAPVTDDRLDAVIAADALIAGENVLAVEVHRAGDGDLAFGCALTAISAVEVAVPPVRIEEIPAAGGGWVELRGVGDAPVEMGSLILATPAGEEALRGDPLAPGEIRLVSHGLAVAPGEVIALRGAGGSALDGAVLDAIRAGERGRARDGDAWRYPVGETPGEANTFALSTDVVINEIMYHAAPLVEEGQPFAERGEEWIELYNRGAAPVDLSGWSLADAAGWTFAEGTVLAPGGFLVVAGDAAALRAAWRGADIVGDLQGRLDNSGARILLLDAAGNTADEVRYHDGGRWPEAADGGGSSLELRDPRADNAAAGAWAASGEGGRAGWVPVRYRGIAERSAVGPDGQWQELVIGLLEAGEVLIDDLSVVADPDGAAVEIVQDGGFDDPDRWRLLGNHRRSSVVPDPDDPGDPVLRLVATGPTEHMHNHVETTLSRAVSDRVTYEISFRARWVSGSNRLHSRLYFNRLARVTDLPRPSANGTPGAPNGMRADPGPTLTDLRQDAALPAAGQPVEIRVRADDPDGVASVRLWSREDGGVFAAEEMAEAAPGVWAGWIAGRPAGALVQFYVEAEDGAGNASTFPAAGPGSRALIRFDDGRAATAGLTGLRLVLTEADDALLHDPAELMSNEGVGATVIYGEEVFHDVEVRAKGSERGRPEVPRLGYGISFNADQPFRGSHRSALIDRSEGVGYGQREALIDLVAARAGLVSAEYNDLIYAITPRAEHTGPAQLLLDRYTGLTLDAQFEDGGDGSLYDYELVYYPLTTEDGTPEGRKLPQPDAVTGTAITDLGGDEEAYRWSFMLQRGMERDDHAPIIGLGQTFALADGAFFGAAEGVIDVDQWLRAFAVATLAGAVDNYGGDGSWHNARFYVRPEDGRILYFPHDLDFFGSAQMAVVGNGDLARLLRDPDYERAYYRHLQDLLTYAYTTAYLGPWCDQIGALLPDQRFAAHCRFIDDRAAWVGSGASDAVSRRFPPVGFAITTNGGADTSTAASPVTLEGTGWIDVRAIRSGGAELPITWVGDDAWQVTVPLQPGDNAITLVAEDLRGAEVGRDAINVRYE